MAVKVHMAGHPWTAEEKDLKRGYQTHLDGRTGFLADGAEIVNGKWMCWVNFDNDGGMVKAVFGDALVLDLPNMVDPIDDGDIFRHHHMPQKLRGEVDDSKRTEEDLGLRPSHLRNYVRIADWNTVYEFCVLDSCQSKYFILPNGAKTRLYKWYFCLLEPHKDYMLHEDLNDEDVAVTPGTVVWHKRKHLYQRLKVLRVILDVPGQDFRIEYKDPETGKLSYAYRMDLAASPYYSLVHHLFLYMFCDSCVHDICLSFA